MCAAGVDEQDIFISAHIHNRIKARLSDKLDKMPSVVQASSSSSSSRVINLSKYTLSAAQKSALSRGLDFSVAQRRRPVLDVIAAVEAGARFLAPDTAAVWKRQIAAVLDKKRPVRRNISRSEAEGLAALKRNTAVTVLQAFEGGAVVLMDTSDYRDKMRCQLDGAEYEKLASDPYPRLERQFRTMAGKLDELRTLLPQRRYAGAADLPYKVPHVYGLPDVHTVGVPLLPVLSTAGSAFQPLSRFLDRILAPLANNSRIRVINAQKILPTLKSFNLGKYDRLCSFSVQSLFSSIPRDRLLLVLRSKLEKDLKLVERTSLGIDSICELVEFLLQATYFQYEDEFFVQTRGLVLGAPLSPILAEIYLQDHEDNALETFSRRPKLIYRYIFDYFIIFSTDNFIIDEFLQHFNSIHPSIILKMESDSDKQISFMDMSLKKSSGSFSISVYRNPFHFNNILHFDSNHSFSSKFKIAVSLFKRAYAYCTESQNLQSEINTIYDILRERYYPEHFIEKAHARAKKTPQELIKMSEVTTTIVIPYVKYQSEIIRRISQKVANVRTAFSYSNTLSQNLTRAKTKTKPPLKNCVYKVPCADCDSVYIGQTKRHVHSRFYEHRRDIRKDVNLEKAESDGHYSKIAVHSKSKEHEIDWKKAAVVHFEKSLFKRQVVEALAMATSSVPVISRPSHTVDDVWTPLFSEVAKHFFEKCKIPIVVCNSQHSRKALENQELVLVRSFAKK